MRLIVRFCIVLALAGLAGCHLGRRDASCVEHQAYQAAVNGAPLRPAEGLPPANTKNALKIPDATVEAKPGASKRACLDEAPSFYADRPKPSAPK